LKSSLFLILFICTFNILGAIDFNEYQLTEVQLDLLIRMEKKDKYPEATLINMAEAFQRHNLKPQRDEYIPPYTEDELWTTMHWAKGGAFASYAEFAGFSFDGESYRADCPNVGLFRFARATGTEFIKHDILKDVINVSYYLQQKYSKNPENFREIFIEEAKKEGFFQYLRPLN